MAQTATVTTPEDQSIEGSGPRHTAGPLLAWCGFALLMVARGYRAFLITLVLAAMVPMVWNWTSYVVKSGSMEPSISVGDVVVGKPHAATDQVPVGKVMIFDNPAVSDHHILMHRVVEALADGTYVSRGDANRSADATPVERTDFRSRAIICIPFVGLPLIWLSNQDLVPLIAWLLATLAAFYFSTRPPCDPRHRRKLQRSKAREAVAVGAAIAQRWLAPVVAGAAILVAAFGTPVASANAAFSATTTMADNTWTASTILGQNLLLDVPGDVLRGTVPLTATIADSGGLAYAVRFEYAPAGTTNWKTVCTDSTAPYRCDWSTVGVANQDYDLRAVAISGATSYVSATVQDVLVDNVAPTVVMQNPGSPLRGTITLAATASDLHSGLARVVIQSAPSGSSTFVDRCTITADPYSCRFDTTTLAGGSYTFRAVATDVAGNTGTSATVTNRVVDNSVPSVSLQDPGATLSGTVNLTAVATSSAGVTSVRIQRAPAGTTTWTDVCTDTSSPYVCGWITTNVTDGLYDLRAVMLDGAGKTTISSTVAGRRVDNLPLRAYDVQTVNRGYTAGRLDTGDTMEFTYNERAQLASITTGWTGNALPVTLRLRDGNLVGTGASGDTIDVLRNGAAVNLGSVNLRQDYLKNNRTVQFAATMTASTTTVNGVSATRITIVVGPQTSGASVSTVSLASVMLWTPSSAVTDLFGRAAASTPASELGVSDREF